MSKNVFIIGLQVTESFILIASKLQFLGRKTLGVHLIAYLWPVEGYLIHVYLVCDFISVIQVVANVNDIKVISVPLTEEFQLPVEKVI